MKKTLFSSRSFKWSQNITPLVLRLTLPVFMLANHGWQKLYKFEHMESKFMSFMGLSPSTSLGLVVFAEFFCSFLLIIGLFTRLAVLPLVITMLVVLNVNDWKVFGEADSELPAIFLIGFVSIFFLGAGKYSIDAMIYKSKR